VASPARSALRPCILPLGSIYERSNLHSPTRHMRLGYVCEIPDVAHLCNPGTPADGRNHADHAVARAFSDRDSRQQTAEEGCAYEERRVRGCVKGKRED
jgi:hypothetical protein